MTISRPSWLYVW